MSNQIQTKRLLERLENLTGKRVFLKEYFFDDKDLETGRTLKLNLWDSLNDGYVKTSDGKLNSYVERAWLPRLRPYLNRIPDDWVSNMSNEEELAMPTLWIESSDAFDMAEQGDYSGVDIVLSELEEWLKKLYKKIKNGQK